MRALGYLAFALAFIALGWGLCALTRHLRQRRCKPSDPTVFRVVVYEFIRPDGAAITADNELILPPDGRAN